MDYPDGFLWGAATAAHQVEGGNWNNDWWVWEHNPNSPCVEPSGDACDQYHRYAEDLDLLVELGIPTYRFSIEGLASSPSLASSPQQPSVTTGESCRPPGNAASTRC